MSPAVVKTYHFPEHKYQKYKLKKHKKSKTNVGSGENVTIAPPMKNELAVVSDPKVEAKK